MTKSECIDILKAAGFRECSSHNWVQMRPYTLSYGELGAPDYYIRYRGRGNFGIKVQYYFSCSNPVKTDHFLSDAELYYLNHEVL